MRRAFRIVAAVLGIVTIGLSLPFAVTRCWARPIGSTGSTSSRGRWGPASCSACRSSPVRAAGGPGPFWVAVASGVATTIAGIVAGDFVSAGTSSPRSCSSYSAFRAPFAVRDRGVDAAPPRWPRSLWCRPWPTPPQSELQRNGLARPPRRVPPLQRDGVLRCRRRCGRARRGVASPGRRIAVWIVGVTGAGLGLASLLLSDYVGAFDPVWAWLALAWGVVFVAGAAPSGRRDRRTEQAEEHLAQDRAVDGGPRDGGDRVRAGEDGPAQHPQGRQAQAARRSCTPRSRPRAVRST